MARRGWRRSSAARPRRARRASGGTPPRQPWRGRATCRDRSMVLPAARYDRAAPWRFRSHPRSRPSSRAGARSCRPTTAGRSSRSSTASERLVFVDGRRGGAIQSRGGKPLERYFPELRFPPGRYVIDGEIVIDGADGLQDFDALSQPHPSSRLADRAAVARDAGALRRVRPAGARGRGADGAAVRRSGARRWRRSSRPRSTWRRRAQRRRGGGLAAERGGRRREAARRAVPARQAHGDGEDQARAHDRRVVVGWRPGKEEGTVGSLILGLYDEAGELQVVGHTSGLRRRRSASWWTSWRRTRRGERGSADPSRWKSDKELEWVALRPELVVEISSTTSAAGGSATGRSCCAGATTRRRRSA